MLVPVILVAGILLVACGSNDPSASEGQSTATAVGSSASTGGGGLSADQAATILIVDFAFSPAQATFPLGTTLTVRNEDKATHTFTSGTINNPEDGFNLQMEGGSSEEITLDEAGELDYFCAIHPGMKGTLEVTA